MTPIKLDNREIEKDRERQSSSSSRVVDIVVVVTPLRINKTDSLTVDTRSLSLTIHNANTHHTIQFIIQQRVSLSCLWRTNLFSV